MRNWGKYLGDLPEMKPTCSVEWTNEALLNEGALTCARLRGVRSSLRDHYRMMRNNGRVARARSWLYTEQDEKSLDFKTAFFDMLITAVRAKTRTKTVKITLLSLLLAAGAHAFAVQWIPDASVLSVFAKKNPPATDN